jgi:hypothetical protein
MICEKTAPPAALFIKRRCEFRGLPDGKRFH